LHYFTRISASEAYSNKELSTGEGNIDKQRIVSLMMPKNKSQTDNVISQPVPSSVSPNHPVSNPNWGGSGEIIGIIMAMTIFAGAVKKLMD
jgi:hypothetical protein